MIFAAVRPAHIGGLFLLCLTTTGALVAGLWLIFQPALPGILHFDDLGNLSGLLSIVDPSSAWRWIQDGRAGPFGRPLALATFALQYYQWPYPEAFLLWNVALHIINALLVFWLAVLVAHRMGERASKQVWIGFCVAFTWGALPLLNSSVLFIVQRMALLASTFVLAGLVGYLKCRGTLRAPWSSQLAALLVLAIFGVLAVFVKESGALIVIFALLIELATIVIARERRLTTACVLLLIGSLLLLAGLTPYAIWDLCAELTRGFDLSQRLGSQGLILPAYLKGLFLPSPGELNPFRFEFLLRDTPDVRWGIAIWVLLMGIPIVAWLVGWRWATLFSGWFIFGHIMESGWVNLEPYFAHRNYLPAVGLVFAGVYGIFALRQYASLWRGLLVAYMATLAGMTWMNTSLWGNRTLAAEMWVIEQPRSVRAALNLAYELERTEGIKVAQPFLDRFVAEKRDSVGLQLQALVTGCKLNPEFDHSQQLRALYHAIATLPFEGWASDLVEKLMETVRKQECNGVSIDQVGKVAGAFLSEPVYQCSRPTVHNMLMILGLVAMDHGDKQNAMALYLGGLRESVSHSMAAFYFDLAQQMHDRAAIEDLQALLGKSSVPRGTTSAEWQALLDRIQAYLHATSPPSDANTESQLKSAR